MELAEPGRELGIGLWSADLARLSAPLPGLRNTSRPDCCLLSRPELEREDMRGVQGRLLLRAVPEMT
jgi:hypothetical protein